MQLLLPLDGHDSGPLFAPLRKLRALVRPLGKAGVIHRAQTKRATPPWADTDAIRAVYTEAARLTRETGDLHVVDHIVPKIGSIVCGLHVPWNLRVVHWRENAKKGAKWWPDMPFEQQELLCTDAPNVEPGARTTSCWCSTASSTSTGSAPVAGTATLTDRSRPCARGTL